MIRALFSVFFLFGALFAQETELKFQRFTINDGLSQNTVLCMLQDKKGFIWLGTSEGLNRYDGRRSTIFLNEPDNPNSLSDSNIRAMHLDAEGILWIGTGRGLNRLDPSTMEFKRYLHDPGDPYSISDDRIRCIYEDRQGALWIGTEGGLNRFDRALQRFQSHVYKPDNPQSLSHDNVTAIREDRSGMLWVGTLASGLNAFDRKAGTFTRFQNALNDPASLSNNSITCIYEDRSGVLWIGTEYGLNKFDRETRRFVRYNHRPGGDPASLSSDWVLTILEDSAGMFWIGTEGGGLNRFDRASGKCIVFRNNTMNPSSISDNRIYSLLEDKAGVLWIGTWNGGANQLNRNAKPFLHYKNIPDNPNSLSDNVVYGIAEDHQGLMWIGTSNGLNRYDRKAGRFTRYFNIPGYPGSLSDSGIFGIVEDASGDLWMGTRNGGLNRYLRAKDRFIAYRHDPRDPDSLAHNAVWCLCLDRQGDLWIGTGGRGLDRLDPRTGKFKHYQNEPGNPHSLRHNTITAIIEDRDGVIWIGSEAGGLSRFDRASGRFKNYVHDEKDPRSLSNDYVQALLQDQTGSLWIGTGNGLDRFDPGREEFTHFSVKDGMPNNTAYGLLEDDNGRIWISTNKGLARFDPRTRTFKNYDQKDGLQSNEFNAGAYCKSRSGELFFGGVNGFNVFHPERIKDNPYVPPVAITDLKIMNQPVPIGKEIQGRIVLRKAITDTESLRLSYKDRVFSFEFSALNYISPEKNEYAYIMENFEKEWNRSGNRNYVMYTNLSPGDYVFRVKASNNDGLWNEEGTSIRITITPPFWRTGWFRAAAALAALFLIIAVFQLRTRSIRRRSIELEGRVEERTEELKLEIMERKRVEKEIEKRQQYLESVLHNAPDAIVTVDADHRIIEWNPGAERIFGYAREEVLGKDLNDIVAKPEVMDEALTITRKTLAGERLSPLETVRFRKDGTPFNVILAASPIRIGGMLQGAVAVYTDITERIKAEEAIKSSLIEKEVLLKEVHHRVKNNMQIISSLLNLQSEHIKDERVIEMFRNSKNRIRSISLIHEKLYQSKDLAHIDLKEYVRSLAVGIFRAYKTDSSEIDLDIQVKDISLSIDKAVPCGLIINELLSNCLKYAFPSSWNGRARITVALQRTSDSQIELMIQDNGVGMPSGLDLHKTESLGIHLVKILAERQLEGEVQVESREGTTFRIRFRDS